MQTALRVLAVVSAVLLAGRAAGAQAPAADDPLRPAREALAAERFAQAESLFRELVSRQPGLIDGYRGLAEALDGQGRSAEAAEVLRRLGDGLLQAGRHADAVNVLDRAARLDPASPRVQALLGKAHLFAQNHLAAVEPLERARQLGDRGATTRLYLAAALWEVGRADEAEDIYVRLTREGPGGFVALHQLGRLLHWQGRSAEAVTYLRQAVGLRHTAADAAFDLAQALAGAGETEAAVAAYRRVLELAPGNYKAHYGLARLLARQGDREAARESMAAYQRLYAAEQETTHREGLERARLDRGWELVEQEAYDEARRHFEALSETPESLAGAATAWSRLGRHDRAVERLEKAVRLAPERQDLQLMLAEERLAVEGRL